MPKLLFPMALIFWGLGGPLPAQDAMLDDLGKIHGRWESFSLEGNKMPSGSAWVFNSQDLTLRRFSKGKLIKTSRFRLIEGKRAIELDLWINDNSNLPTMCICTIVDDKLFIALGNTVRRPKIILMGDGNVLMFRK